MSRWPTLREPGIADDKVIYAYVPEMIRYYLDRRTDLGECADVRLLSRG